MRTYAQSLAQAARVVELLPALEPALKTAAQICVETLRKGGKLLLCGNGGSAAEAHHLSAELMGRFDRNRRPWPAVVLSADGVLMTCVANDFRFEDIFARQVTALGAPGDALLAFSTSGNSPNVLEALGAARSLRLQSVAFLGRDGGAARSLADCAIVIAHPDTARIQEGHQFLIHCLMDLIEEALAE